ncbi:putative DNA-binding transcriptional regulator YafY [Flavobacterium nitrogenifigens]|uniref:DNA-binding transcriptional regulator YafY n=2 Tax=Flavobacterium TaxID=237 RepID=A0ABR6Q7K1_9FLAO|nr:MULTISPECIES: YafY family protein [Flavobacterium]MBB4801055.1 putative DNA-binding transcriptional regulator YafY [Flavobacterium nitrogenifigens]MBB6385197.1 putative DNA-binding transcriptional regulator YafY [Flavobacterium notoginsengisoli]
MLDETPKRFDRIVAILIQLQSKKIVKAQELADRFDCSLRTIYRDIRTLEASGVPIYSEAGVGYALMEGYRLPPVMFTREEVSSFIAAEKLMQKFTDPSLGTHYASAMFKLKSVLRSTDKDYLSNIESKIVMQNAEPMFNDNSPNTLAVLFESIAEKKQILLTYKTFDKDETTQRNLEPIGVFHDNNNWYFLGYCHLRKDYRQFRTDRIQEIKKTEHDFTIEHDALETYLTKEETTCPTTKVRILIDRKIARYLSSEKKYHGFISQKEVDEKIEMTFMSRDINNAFPRWFLMFGDYAEILEPEILKTNVLQLIEIHKKRLS